MASIRGILISLVFLLFVLSLAESRQVLQSNLVTGTPTDGTYIDCGGACETRCKESSRPNLCKRACGSCCSRCSCVPPGTNGNYETCPCYANMTTHGGQRKCP
ncbi:hypothetical protein LUZ60_006993 [Juncus effusus]|nr:hypothetical protein LUZ60_006993 [Juncus effusus]